ncbi:MAG TPA: proton-conducting transporter membrane subunit, partial [Acidimicrobiia bacterium]|nr:proton-conducting transporter membrane subunit [Acidimicrobiia bacterium]
MAFPYATALLAVPAAGAAVTAAIPESKEKAVRAFAVGVSLVALVISVALLVDFDKSVAGYQFVESKVWIDALGIRYLMGVDGISLFMVVLTGLLFPIALLASTHVSKRANAYFALMLMLEAALMGIFLSVDLFLFFVFWEAMLVPMYFLIGTWGYERRIYAALKFFIYTAAGSALLLLGILSLAVLHAKAPGAHLTFDLRTLSDWKGLNPNTARWLFLA